MTDRRISALPAGDSVQLTAPALFPVTDATNTTVKYTLTQLLAAFGITAGGSDGYSVIVIGTGGSAPTGNRSAQVAADTPSSAGFPGAAYFIVKRAGSAKWYIGIREVVSGPMAATSDLVILDSASSPLVAIAQTTGNIKTVGTVTTTGLVTTTTNPATVGAVRMGSGQGITWRDSTNSFDFAGLYTSGGVMHLNAESVVSIDRATAIAAQAITYSASMTIDASVGNLATITATNATAFTINAPTTPTTGQWLTVRIRNTSGGALGVATWNAVFKMTAWTQPATGFSRAITFDYDGTSWIERTRNAADVPN